jgi:hypothetical protein
MPRFCDILDRALALALDQQAYEVARLIDGPPVELDRAWRDAAPLEIRRYNELITKAYMELRSMELRTEQLTRK